MMIETAAPILYSFRRCPYAMRARAALYIANQSVELREIVLKNKPASMLEASVKGTVPVLIVGDQVIDESLDIMLWALHRNDPKQWLLPDLKDTLELINLNDNVFKYWLDRYKYADRYPEHTQAYYRENGEVFLNQLNTQLSQSRFLFGSHITLADAAIMPFIRQFSLVDEKWFNASHYPALQMWLNTLQEHRRFTYVMQKYTPWQPNSIPVYF